MKRQIAILSMLALSLFAFSTVKAQEVAVRPSVDDVKKDGVSERKSPVAISTLKKGDTYVKITYCQPQLRGRQMLGKQVSYGKVWRLGANEATEIMTNVDLEINGETLPAGMYSLYAIPNEDEWTIIVNKALGQWGAYSYDQSMDVFRTTVETKESSEKFEAFSIWFNEDGDMMHMAWNNTRVDVPIDL